MPIDLQAKGEPMLPDGRLTESFPVGVLALF